ncbi:GDSL esterase/lipase At2g30310-like [Corylus avellana]|uniref:GDSL esterase/lipase At2g30310-like n=1 Tax=Corylus avellana TaxID=13451 RepID=UPI00286CAA9D|nr:GDSL esterase/lipase At2g30310-like [Corylus avellana]
MKMLLPSSFIIFLQVLTTVSHTCKASTALPKFTAMLVFGDSSVDTGNNNYVLTAFQANHYPYGQDYPGHVPTGRFSDGKLIPDLIASSLGIKESVPPFLEPLISNDELRTGVNFASAGSGFDDLTAAASGVVSFSTQILYFKSYIERLKGFVGEAEATKIINGALVIISAGTNDFAINFYNLPTRRLQFTIGGYQDFLQVKIKEFVQELYDLGCRTMIIGGLFPIGCAPIQITASFKDPNNRTCVQEQNLDAQSYNQKLANLIPKVQQSLPGSRLIFSDTYELLYDMINNPQKYGFVETNRGCCGTGFFEAGLSCNQITPVCANTSQYLFWDSIHPSQAAYQYIAKYLEDKIIPIHSTDHSR